MEDIGHKIDINQFGGKKGVGTEHMIVAMMDRILGLLDSAPSKSVVIVSGVDWEAAYDWGDPTKAILKFIKLGLWPSLVSLLGDYLSHRKMTVNYNSAKSSTYN